MLFLDSIHTSTSGLGFIHTTALLVAASLRHRIFSPLFQLCSDLSLYTAVTIVRANISGPTFCLSNYSFPMSETWLYVYPHRSEVAFPPLSTYHH